MSLKLSNLVMENTHILTYILSFEITRYFKLLHSHYKINYHVAAQPVKLDLNKKSLPKQKNIQNFTIDAQGFRKTKNENPPTWEIRVTS